MMKEEGIPIFNPSPSLRKGGRETLMARTDQEWRQLAAENPKKKMQKGYNGVPETEQEVQWALLRSIIDLAARSPKRARRLAERDGHKRDSRHVNNGPHQCGHDGRGVLEKYQPTVDVRGCRN